MYYAGLVNLASGVYIRSTPSLHPVLFFFQSAVKMLLRSHNLDALREERKLYWRSIYLRLEAASSSSVVSASRATSISDAEALVEATTQLYKETVMTCFGTMGMYHKPCLTENGRSPPPLNKVLCAKMLTLSKSKTQ